MPNWNDDIDGEHLKIASHEGTMRVLAGPGTGKSYALKRKVMRLLQEGVDPSKILALTFTNVAADALKKDLSGLDVAGAELVKARTLHSLCFEILRREHVFEITDRNPRPLMDFEKDFLLEDLKNEFGNKTKTKALLIAYESAFARQQQDIPGAIQNTEDARFKERLLRWLKIHRAILIGELVPITYEYLRTNPNAPELSEFKFILVDEYQDLNKAEQSLIDLLAGSAELVVVGDDDQSIYSFKHAHPAGIISFPTTHAPLEDVILQVCRRCPKKVVALANELMGYDLGTNPKKLGEHAPNKEGEIFATQWENVSAETKGIARIIKKMISDDTLGIKPEDILVLSPRRQMAYDLRDELQNTFAIPSHTFFQEEALDTEKSKKAYSLLNYLAFPDDRVSFRALLGLPTPLSATYEKIVMKAEELSKTPREVILGIKDGSINIPATTGIVARFDMVEEVRASLEGKSLEEIIALLFNVNEPEDIEVLLSVINLIDITEDINIQKLFSKLQEKILSSEVIETAGYIKIMSLHKSKGLTSRVVFILGCVAGLIPSIHGEQNLIDTNKTTELESFRAEAKRLFFVAITRTTEYLIFSSFREIEISKARSWGVRTTPLRGRAFAQTQTSPFFADIRKNLPTVTTGSSLLKKFGIAD